MKAINKVLVFLVVILCSQLAFGQSELTVSEKSGDKFKLKRTRILEIFPNGDGFGSISSNGLNYYAASFDKDLNFIKGKFLYLEYEGKYLTLQKIVKFKDDILLFVSYNNTVAQKTYLFYTIYDPDNLTTEKELVKIAETKSSTKKTTLAKFDIKVSEDENHLLILGMAPLNLNKKFNFRRLRFEEKPSKRSSFTMWVLDKNRDIVNYVKNHKVIDEDGEYKYQFEDFAINKDGIVYILGKNLKLKSKDKKDDDSDQRSKSKSKIRRKSKKTWESQNAPAYLLQQIMPNGEINYFETESGLLYTDMTVIIGPSGNPHLVGLLGEEIGDLVVTTGIVYSKLSVEDLSILSEVKENFTEEVLNEINDIREEESALSDRQKQRSDRMEAKLTQEQKKLLEIAKRAALNMNTIVYAGLDEEEHPVIVLEEQYLIIVTTTTTNSNGTTTTTTTYYYSYNDLLIAKVFDDKILQQAYSKTFTSVNSSLTNSIAVFLDDGQITIMAQEEAIRMNGDLQELNSQKFKSKSRGHGKRKRSYAINLLKYKRSIGDNTVIGIKRAGFRWALVKIEAN